MRVSGYKENQEYYRKKMLKLLEQNKRYREAIGKAMSEMETLERYGNENAIAAYVTLKEALEGNK